MDAHRVVRGDRAVEEPEFGRFRTKLPEAVEGSSLVPMPEDSRLHLERAVVRVDGGLLGRIAAARGYRLARMRTVTVWLFALALTVLSGCGGDDDDDRAAGSAPTAAALAGTTYVSTAVTGHELVEGTTLTLGFPEAGKLTAAAGCNSYFGDFDVTDGKLDVGQLGGTLIGCPPELQQQDEWMAAFLGSEPEIALDGDTLTLTGTDATIVFADRQDAEPDVAPRRPVGRRIAGHRRCGVERAAGSGPSRLRGRSDHGQRRSCGEHHAAQPPLLRGRSDYGHHPIVHGPRYSRQWGVAMRTDCKHYESRTYQSGDVVRKCNIDLAPEAPWKCPDQCPGYERKMLDAGWVYGSLGHAQAPPDEPMPSGDDVAALLDEAEEIVNAAGADLLDEQARKDRKRFFRKRKRR